MTQVTPITEDQQEGKGQAQDACWVEDTQNGPGSDIMATYLSYDPEFRLKVEQQLRRKIDMRILPVLVLIYIMNYLDRNSITRARLYGLQNDTDLNGAEYNTAISIFSAGYIAMQLPSTLLMTKLRPSIYLVRLSVFTINL